MKNSQFFSANLLITVIFPLLTMQSPIVFAKDITTKTVPQKKYIKRNLEYWKNLTPEEKQKILQHAEKMNNLSGEEKKKLREKIEKWRKLSPEDRKELKDKLQSASESQ